MLLHGLVAWHDQGLPLLIVIMKEESGLPRVKFKGTFLLSDRFDRMEGVVIGLRGATLT